MVRVLAGAGLRFTVDNIPSSLDYQLVINYESEVNKTALVLVLGPIPQQTNILINLNQTAVMRIIVDARPT